MERTLVHMQQFLMNSWQAVLETYGSSW